MSCHSVLLGLDEVCFILSKRLSQQIVEACAGSQCCLQGKVLKPLIQTAGCFYYTLR